MRKVRLVLVSFAAFIALLGFSLVNATPASAVTGPIGVQQTFKVAPFSRTIKTSNGPYGTGVKEKVLPGKTAKRFVWSIQIPPHCQLNYTFMGINFVKRNDKNKSIWKSNGVPPYGRAHARIICR